MKGARQKTKGRRQREADSHAAAGRGPEHPGPQRLQKILSGAGVASRRLAEQLIVQARVSVNGSVVTELGTKADPARDEIRVDGRRILGAQRRRYILLNKPRGYVTTRSDPQGRPTVMNLLADVREYLYPVGRLDYDSEGLLILTNDGDLAARLTHPRHEVERVYEARVRGVPGPREIDRLEHGVIIDGRRTAPARARLARTSAAPDRRNGEPRSMQSVLILSIQEGRHRQVRKMLEAVGHPVVRLRRVQIGPIGDRELRTGHYRELTPAEVAMLQRATGAS